MFRAFYKRSFLILIALTVTALYILYIPNLVIFSNARFTQPFSFNTENLINFRTNTKSKNIPISRVLSGEYPNISQVDPRIIGYIKDYLLYQPSGKPYQTPIFWKDPSEGQSKYVRKLLNNKKNGFFVEAGAYDGVRFSNTLYLEAVLGWTGLLVEANPSLFRKLVSVKRNAWISNACLSTLPYPHKANFTWEAKSPLMGGILEDNAGGTKPNRLFNSVQCVPVYSILKSLEVTSVDYLSLDVEGSEIGILKTIPFEEVTFKVITIEYNMIPRSKGYSYSIQAIIEILVPHGYVMVGISPSVVSNHHDVVFIHRDVPYTNT